MRKTSRVVALCMIGILMLLVPMQVSAKGTQEMAIGHSNHKWVYDHKATSYVENNLQTHYKMSYNVYVCSITGCNKVDVRDESTITQAHTKTGFCFAGDNFHDGEYHYALYKDTCIQCGHTVKHWEHYVCPGNGHCILPQALSLS